MQPRRGRPNRQGRGDRNQNSPRPQNQNRPPPSRTPFRSTPNTAVPSYSSIQPGTQVSIVLKVDQPTGRQVTGLVSELLTRGDHPRGVKVRLRDGRVGRVQKLVSEDEAKSGEEMAGGAGAGLGRDGETRGGGGGYGSDRGAARGGGRGRGNYRHVQDVREDEYVYDESAPQSRSLGAYFGALEEADAAAARKSTGMSGSENGEEAVGKGGSETVVCPVCHEWEGDEKAVAWHVEGHFANV